MSTAISLLNDIAVSLFGSVLSASFCGALDSRRNRVVFWCCMVVIPLASGWIYATWDGDFLRMIYPLIIHLPLILLMSALTKRPWWSAVSVLTAYLCCQLRRWLALVCVWVFSGGDRMQYAVELIVTLPLLLLLLRTAPAVRSVSRYSVTVQCQFGCTPALYYAFDYLTRVYTNLLADGDPAVVEFMPFVCCVAYLMFLARLSKEQEARAHLEQLQNSLNLQVGQAVREIEALRESQQKTRAYRHDLRHHLQYLSGCLENGQYEQAQRYIHEINAEIEAARVVTYCENEAANLIFSAFAARAEAQGVKFSLQAVLPHILPISESDLCVLLSNALENALHACKGADDSIEVQTYERNEKFFLQVVNDCREAVRFEDGIPVTDRPGHGIGVSSICAIVERYGGLYSFSVKEGKFVLRVSL